jgi:hypothetical protein
MKTKDLIALLQEADPTGEEECCIGNTDIYFVERLPAYWDGPLQVLKKNPDTEYYSIIGAEYRRSGTKIDIKTFSINDAIFNDENLPVTYDSENAEKYCCDRVEKYRKEAVEIKNDIERGHFIEYVGKKYKEHSGEYDLGLVAKWYYDNNWNYKTPLPEDLDKCISINDRREIQWDRGITWEQLMHEYDDTGY